ncbi:unnamed protein product, partial [Discosporangium mesarthrocarpum]
LSHTPHHPSPPLPNHASPCPHPPQGTVKCRLLSLKYTTLEAFASDVRLVFQNAITFNPEQHFVHTAAVHLLQELNVS